MNNLQRVPVPTGLERPAAAGPAPADVEAPLDRRDAWDDERLFQAISENAYFRAERRGFLPGDELADWIAAEQEVRLSAGLRSTGM